MNNFIFPTYYAHSVENQPEFQWQTMYSHGNNVGNKAAEFAVFFGAQEIGSSSFRVEFDSENPS